MPQIHEKLPKDQAPQKGEVYTLIHNEVELYKAEILKYGGGCWATVKVLERIDAMDDPMYAAGSSFDVRVAMYRFRHEAGEQTKA